MAKRGRPPLKLTPEERLTRRRTQFVDSQRKARASKRRVQSTTNLQPPYIPDPAPESLPSHGPVIMHQWYGTLDNAQGPHLDATTPTAACDQKLPSIQRSCSELLDIAVPDAAMSGFSPASITQLTHSLRTDAHSLPGFRSETSAECPEPPLRTETLSDSMCLEYFFIDNPHSDDVLTTESKFCGVAIEQGLLISEKSSPETLAYTDPFLCNEATSEQLSLGQSSDPASRITPLPATSDHLAAITSFGDHYWATPYPHFLPVLTQYHHKTDAIWVDASG